jgi:hypothetical protein
MIACYQEKYSTARSLYAESLRLLLPLEDEIDIAECIMSIGRFLGAYGSFKTFARLLGAAEAAVPQIKKKTFLLFKLETEKFIASACAALGDEGYHAVYDLGKQMSLAEAVDFARKELGS